MNYIKGKGFAPKKKRQIVYPFGANVIYNVTNSRGEVIERKRGVVVDRWASWAVCAGVETCGQEMDYETRICPKCGARGRPLRANGDRSTYEVQIAGEIGIRCLHASCIESASAIIIDATAALKAAA